MDRRLRDLEDNFREGQISRRELFRRAAVIAGGSAAGIALLAPTRTVRAASYQPDLPRLTAPTNGRHLPAVKRTPWLNGFVDRRRLDDGAPFFGRECPEIPRSMLMLPSADLPPSQQPATNGVHGACGGRAELSSGGVRAARLERRLAVKCLVTSVSESSLIGVRSTFRAALASGDGASGERAIQEIPVDFSVDLDYAVIPAACRRPTAQASFGPIGMPPTFYHLAPTAATCSQRREKVHIEAAFTQPVDRRHQPRRAR
jgi:hypothetical protein